MIKQKNIHSDYRIIGVFSSAAAYLADRNKTSAAEGDTYYDTTLNYLRTHDGSNWSPAGMTGIGPGSIDAVLQIGAKSTNTDQIETERSYAGALFVLDQNSTNSAARCINLENASNDSASITMDFASTNGYDIDGTSSAWYVEYDGDALFNSVSLLDSKRLYFGNAIGSGDVSIRWDQTNLLIEAATDDLGQIRLGSTNSMDFVIYGSTNTKIATWDVNTAILEMNGWDINLQDEDYLLFGDSDDISIVWDQTQLQIDGAAADTAIWVGYDKNQDIIIYGDTTTDAITFDTSAESCAFNGFDLTLQDDDLLYFGNSSDFSVTYVGASDILRIAGDDKQLDLGVSGAGFDMYWMTEDTGNYIYWDENNSRMDLVDVDLRLDDEARLYFGSDADAYLVWDNANSTIDIVGSVSVTGNWTISGGLDIGNFVLADDEKLWFGNSNDFVFHYDGTNANLEIDAAAANDQIDFGATTATDILFNGATAARDAHWDASANTLGFLDNTKLGFGNTAASPDITMTWDATRLNITGSGLEIRLGADTAPLDVRFYGTTTGDYMLFDGDMNTNGGVICEDITITMMDNVNLLFGDGASAGAGDFKVYSDGTDLFIQEVAAAAGLNLKLGTSGKGLQVIFYGDTAGYDLYWLQSADTLEFQDNAKIGLGTDSDVTIKWDATNLLIEAATQDTGIIKIGATNALDFNIYGNTATSYASFDSGAASLLMTAYHLGLKDDSILRLGDSNDITVTWDQTQLQIDGAAADTAIWVGYANNQDLIIYGDTTTDAITFDTSAESCAFNGFDLTLQDDDVLKLGDSSDITVTWDQTRLNIDGAAANTAIRLGYVNNQDLIIYGQTTTKAITFDTDDTAKSCAFDGFDLKIQDDDKLYFGDSTSDCYLSWDQTNLLLVPSSQINIGNATNYCAIGSTGNIAMTGNAKVTCGLGTNFGGLILPQHATSSPSGAGGTGAIYFEVDASKLWVNIGGTNWIGTVLS